jgi:hypothetical protein
MASFELSSIFSFLTEGVDQKLFKRRHNVGVVPTITQKGVERFFINCFTFVKTQKRVS